MAVRSIVVRLRAEVADFRNQMASAASAVDRNSAAINDLSGKAALMGGALVGLAGVAVAKFADFDAAMSKVAASGEDARGSINQLRDAAVKAGKDTQYSATEAANGITELAKAGVSAKDILAGGLSGALTLAAAGELEVADAAEIAATALTQFSLKGTDVTHVADLLAAGAGKAQGSVADLSNALKQGGLVAAQTGLSIEETTGGLAAFASAGLVGADAGTSFKSMLQRLNPQSKEAQKAMDALGLSAYDSQGNFVGLANFAGQLQTAMKDLTPEARNAAMGVIFGSDAVRAASVLYNQGADGIQKWTDAVNDQGYAAESAAILTDNLKGDLERLGGSIDTVFIQAGSGANKTLRAITTAAGALVDKLGELPQGALTATTAIAGAGGLGLLGVAAIGKLATTVVAARTAFQGMGISAKAAGRAVAGVGGAVGIATLAVTAWANAQADAKAKTDDYMATLDEFGNRTDDTVKKISDALTEDRRSWIDSFYGDPETLIDKGKALGLTLEDLQGYIIGTGDAVDKVQGKIDAYRESLGTGFDRLGAEDFTEPFQKALDKESKTLTDAEKKKLQQVEANRAMGASAAESATSTDLATTALQDYTSSLGDGMVSADEYAKALDEVVKWLDATTGGALSARDAQRGYQGAIDDAAAAVKKNGQTLDIHTEKGRANQAALDDIAKAGLDLIDAQHEQGASEDTLQKTMGRTRESFIKTAQKMGLSKKAAKELADELGLIPKNVNVKVAASTEAAQSELTRFVNRNDGSRIRINVDMQGGKSYQFAPGALVAHAAGGRVSGPAGASANDAIHLLITTKESA